MKITPITFDARDLERADYDVEKVLGRPDSYMHFGNDKTFDTWSVGPVVLTRDSEIIDQANYAVLVASLKAAEEAGDIEPDSYELTRANHWAVGWVEHLGFLARTETGMRHVVLGQRFAGSEQFACDDHFAYAVMAEDEDDAMEAVKSGPLAGCKNFDILGTGTGDFKLSIPIVDVPRMTRVGRWVHAWLGMLQEYPVADDTVYDAMASEESRKGVAQVAAQRPFYVELTEQQTFDVLRAIEEKACESLRGEWPREEAMRDALAELKISTAEDESEDE